MFFPEIDPRLEKWPLMENANMILVIVLIYLAFVKVIGPAWMEKRKPYDLRKPMLVYNFVMVFVSAWMFYKFGKHGWFGKYSYNCEPVNFRTDEDAMGMVEVSWYFFISKILELADTVFFVLRKKYSNISALHVIHHAIVPLTARFTISRGSAGYNTLFGFVNSFIHIWMYLYYALAAFGPGIQKYLWWKKYLTTLQMIQFCFMFCAAMYYVVNPSCETNPVLIALILGQAGLFLGLFANFYIASYKKKNTKTDQQVKSVTNGHTTETAQTHMNGNVVRKHKPAMQRLHNQITVIVLGLPLVFYFCGISLDNLPKVVRSYL